MKTAVATGLLGLAVGQLAAAFPTEVMDKIARDPASANEITKSMLEKRDTFKGAAQLISVSGAHAWVAPGPTDLRGPCPGLNALANHNYLPHNGFATLQQFEDAVETVYGMESGLANTLAVLGAATAGSVNGWSIGGPPPPLGTGTVAVGLGISNTHNTYEGDASPTRGDRFSHNGDDYSLQLSQFQELFSMQPNAATASYDLTVLTAFRAKRFQESISQNPYFFQSPVSGVIVLPAAYSFIYRFMANHTAEQPDGILKQDVLKSFFSITGNSGAFTYTPGYERIPDNWYRRSLDNPYSGGSLTSDANAMAKLHPEFYSIGGNLGAPNTYTDINLYNYTLGVYSGRNLLEGDNFLCYFYQVAQSANSELLSGLLNGLLKTLSCPLTLKGVNNTALAQFPGSKSS